MRVLILSCNTGEGHNSCAKAIKEIYDIKGDDCVITDALMFISEKTSRFISWGHVFVYRNLPWLFDCGYKFIENRSTFFKQSSCLYNFFARGSGNLYRFIIDGEYDAVICVHPFAALMLTEARRRYGLLIKTAFVATDYTCSPSVKDNNLNYYFIPEKTLLGDFECPNISKEKIVASGIPIRQMFYKRTEKAVAKNRLGLSADRKHIVIMCGSMGCGPLKKLVGLLSEQLQDEADITVICGTNEKLKRQLEQKYANRTNLHICGYVKDMSAMLDSADLYLTKPGGISVTEAATKKLPMVFINAVGGCENYNSTFYTQLGCAKKSSDVKELLKLCTSLITDESGYEVLASAFEGHCVQNAAECIYTALRS